MSTLEEKLTKMARHGQSVMLNWGEDDNLWECSYITGGKRYTAFHAYPTMAVVNCLAKVPEPETGVGSML